MQQIVSEFISKYSLQTSEHIRYIDLVSEIGELGKEILASTSYGKNTYTQTSSSTEELGDCIFSLLALCYEMNVNAEDVLQSAIAKYETRFQQKGHISSEMRKALNHFSGAIIEESLQDTSVLSEVKIIETNIYPVEERHETPWLEKWTLHIVEVPPSKADYIAEKISNSIDVRHIGNWYADFKNEQCHYVIFHQKVFKLKTETDWAAMRSHARSIGVPEHQIL